MVTTLRMCVVGDRHVGRLERHSEREGEIDEIPIDRLRRAREFEAGAARPSRLAVDQMRIVKRVDRVAEQPGERQRDDDQAPWSTAAGLWPIGLRGDRDQQHGHHDRR